MLDSLGKVALVALVLAGCPSTSVYRTADPIAEGDWQVGGATGVGVMSDREQETRFPTGHFEASVRRGMSENLDLGAKLYVAGVEANATWRVYKATWSVALAPSLAGLNAQESGALPESIHLFAGLTAIASRPISKRWNLALGPTTGWGLYLPSTGGSAQGVWLGGFVHAQVKLGEHWLLGPELTSYQVVAGQVPVRGGAFQLGLGVFRAL